MKTFSTIAVGTDFSPVADIAVETAIEIASRVSAKRVHVVHILDSSAMTAPYPYAYTSADMARIEFQRRKIALTNIEKIDTDRIPLTREVRAGIPSRDLAAVAEEVQADLLVVASHGYGVVRRALLGSVAGALIRAAHCPVLVVGENRHATRFNHVLAAIDLSPVSAKVLSYAAGLVSPRGRVKALSLYDTPVMGPDEMEQMRADREREVMKLVGQLTLNGVIVEAEAMSKAPAANVILDTADILGADLIAVGTSGHNAWHRMIIGSTATKVISEAKVPVLVVPFDAPPAD